jgi:hypothetical protein
MQQQRNVVDVHEYGVFAEACFELVGDAPGYGCRIGAAIGNDNSRHWRSSAPRAAREILQEKVDQGKSELSCRLSHALLPRRPAGQLRAAITAAFQTEFPRHVDQADRRQDL